MVPENLLEKNLAELRAMAQALGVKNIGKYRKNDLIEMLSGKSETPAPKKRGRPTKGASASKEKPVAAEPAPAQKPAAETAEPAPAQEPPKAKAPARGKNDRKRKEQGEKPAPENKAAASEEKPQTAETPAPEPAKSEGEGRGDNTEKQEQRRRDNRSQNNRYQKGYPRHFGNYPYSEHRSQGENNQGQKPLRPAAPANPVPAGEEEKPYYNQEYGTANPAVPRMLENENCPPVEGVLEVLPDGYGFLRMNNYYSGPKDIYLSITQIGRAHV